MELEPKQRNNELVEKKQKSLPAKSSKDSIRIKVLQIIKDSRQKLEFTAKVATNFNHSDNGDDNIDNINVIIEGVWLQNNLISQNTLLHLINPQFNETTNTYIIDNSQGFAVIEPDNLLTCTYVASSLFCERKTWLNHVFLGQVGTNRAMLVGTLVHEVFQYGVKNKIVDQEKLIKYLDDLLDDATVMLEIYSVELHLKDVKAEAITYIPSVREWIEKYMLAGPRYPLTNDQDIEVKIIGIQDIEENVWSTKYGLKGKIDVTGSVRVYNRRNKTLVDKTIPLELKTGNPNLSSSHSAQVSLYSMMIEDRYSETNQGFVIYLKDKAAMHNIPLTHNIKRDLVQRRNQINYSMKNYFLGPEMIDQTRMCKNCDRLTECILMSQIYTPGQIDQYSSMKSLAPEAINHLDDKFIKFFQKYHEKLVALMSSSTNSPSSGSFWTNSSDEAESKGSGFGKLQAILPSDKNCPYITFKRHPRYNFTKPDDVKNACDNDVNSKPIIKKQKIFDYFKPVITNNNNSNSNMNIKSQSPKKTKPFNTSFNFTHCRVAISVDQDDLDMDSQNSSTAIAIGFINELKEDHFVMKLYEGGFDPLKLDLMYRVDRIEKRIQVDIERTVLVRLLAREDWRCERVRELILNPNFLPTKNIKLNHFVLTTCFDEICELEKDEQKFVVEAASTENYYLLNEKIDLNNSMTILIRILTDLDRSLLIVARNVDDLVDLMKKLQHKKIKFILIDDGKSAKARHQFAANLVKVPQVVGLDNNRKFDAYIKQHETAKVVITSYAMSIGGLLFTRKTFDYCVAYDCDKTELLISLSPMFCSDRYIIIDICDENISHEEKIKAKTSNSDHVSLGEHLRNLR